MKKQSSPHICTGIQSHLMNTLYKQTAARFNDMFTVRDKIYLNFGKQWGAKMEGRHTCCGVNAGYFSRAECVWKRKCIQNQSETFKVREAYNSLEFIFSRI